MLKGSYQIENRRSRRNFIGRMGLCFLPPKLKWLSDKRGLFSLCRLLFGILTFYQMPLPADFRKKSAFFQNHAGQKVDLKSGSDGQFFNRYIFQETLLINSERFDRCLTDPSISFAPASSICHPLGKALLSPGPL